MATFLNKLEDRANLSGIERNTMKSLKWFQKEVKGMRTPSRSKLLNDENLIKTNRPLVGRMFFYQYDPKHKKTLPYYDRFPLIFMVDKAEGGFYGLNLHYLPPKWRAIFFDRLTDYTNNKKYNRTTRLKLSYDLLKGSSRLSLFGPCFKHYLTDHVKSRIIEVPADQWESILFLPTEQFVKAKASKIWNDSRKKF
tara:strand:- start:203 stop:787 length:585 start_codon:yes stop_codon:yes gene_type:complete